MANIVVIDTLADAGGVGVLDCDGIDDQVSFGIIADLESCSWEGVIAGGVNTGYILGVNLGARFEVNGANITFLGSIDGTTWDSSFSFSSPLIPDGYNSVSVTNDGVNVTVNINGNTHVAPYLGFWACPESFNVARREARSDRLECIMYSLVINSCDYHISSSFGDTSLTSSGCNSGTISGATWNKVINGQPVDEVFASQAVYKGTWGASPIPPQIVYDTVGTLPPTGDASWDGEDVTVVDVSKKSILYLLKFLLGEAIMLDVNGSIRGETLPASGKHTLPTDVGYFKYLKALSAGTIVARLRDNKHFSTINVLSDGAWYPTAPIFEIDMTASTVNFDDVEIGY